MLIKLAEKSQGQAGLFYDEKFNKLIEQGFIKPKKINEEDAKTNPFIGFDFNEEKELEKA